MTLVEYLVKRLIENKVTDVFGIPGGAVLPFLYEVQKHSPLITPRLSFHEQAAAFSAAGYAQSNGELGVVYATRGPGITNTLTAVADAYYESVPLLVITAHNFRGKRSTRRIDENQELDATNVFKTVTKATIKIKKISSASNLIDCCINLALDGRKGPVLLDIDKSLFNCDIKPNSKINEQSRHIVQHNLIKQEWDNVLTELKKSRRPILLIGDGIRQSSTNELLSKITNKIRIPIISSRYTQDLQKNNPIYFGYLGSHGLRYTNFILSKTDFIIVFGNNLNFPDQSVTFRKVFSKAKVRRFDIDERELVRSLENLKDVKVDLRQLFSFLLKERFLFTADEEWLNCCSELKSKLFLSDVNEPIEKISKILAKIPREASIVSDVGNNEFWLCRAYALSNCDNKILFSKSFGAMGSSIPKAIGIYYDTLRPVISFNGDQAFQMNIQELQAISNSNLPITVVIVNNSSSGMIRTRQINSYSSNFLQTTIKSGYSNPSFKNIANAYGFHYFLLSSSNSNDLTNIDFNIKNIIEVQISDQFDLFPSIKIGDDCQNMYPYLDKDLYQYLDNM